MKLPSNRQVLAVLFYNIRHVKLNVQDSANLVMRECIIFWEKARIPTKHMQDCVKKLVNLYKSWKSIQKNGKKTSEFIKDKEKRFESSLDNLFDIAHANALTIITVEEDKIFLQQQREAGRLGYLGGVDWKLAEKEERSRKRLLNEEVRRLKHINSANSQQEICCSSASDNSVSPLLLQEEMPVIQQTRGRKEFITPKLVGALDRCHLSIKNSVYIIQATIEALGHNVDDFPINKSSIHRIRTQIRKERAEGIKSDFKNNIPDVVTLHWDGKLLPGITVLKGKEERLPIVITFGDKEQLLAVPKLDNSSGKEQATAIFGAINDWQLSDKVQIMCCDTTASNTGRFNGACHLLEQKLERELLLFGCRHHVLELVLKCIFKTKKPQITLNADIPRFKKFRDNWKNIDFTKIQICNEKVKQHFSLGEIDELLRFYFAEL